MSRARFAVLLGLFAAGTLPAQSLPPITRSKEAAKRAVEATNAHTATMTANQDSMPAQGGNARGSADSAQAAASGRATQSAAGSTAPLGRAPGGQLRPGSLQLRARRAARSVRLADDHRRTAPGDHRPAGAPASSTTPPGAARSPSSGT